MYDGPDPFFFFFLNQMKNPVIFNMFIQQVNRPTIIGKVILGIDPTNSLIYLRWGKKNVFYKVYSESIILRNFR